MASTLTCESDFTVLGMQEGEDYSTPVRVLATLCVVSITSSWFSLEKIKRLSLFFTYWLSGLALMVGYLIENSMVSACWTSRNLEGFIKTLKFIELAASNMLAVTNLAICVNLALIVLSHRTMSRVKSVSSPPLILLFLAVSVGIAAASIPFWDAIFLLGTAFWTTSHDEGAYSFITVSMCYVEFFVGTCMFIIVVGLVASRMKEIKECWKLHRRIRYYFVLTIIGTAVNLGLGICGTLFALRGNEGPLLLVWSWIFRYIHIALDTIVLSGVLRERNIDERSDDVRTRESAGLSSGQRLSGNGARSRGGSEGFSNTSKPIMAAPMV